jgi:tetratricopeptide (TPR) repeat protein
VENRQVTVLVPEQAYSGEGAVTFDFNRGRFTFGLDRRTWSGEEAGFSTVALVFGAAGERGLAKQAGFRRIAVSGLVNPQWIAKQTSAYQDILAAELAREHSVVSAAPPPSGFAASSLDEDPDGVPEAYRASYREALAQLEAFGAKRDVASFLQAWRALGAVTQRHATLAQPPYYLGRLADQVWNRAEAVRCYDEALRRCPEFPEALAARARQHVEEGRWSEARGVVDRAVDLKPDLAEARLVRARLQLRDGRIAPALEEAALAEKLAPFDPDLRKRCRMLANVIRGPGWIRDTRHASARYRIRSDLPAAKVKAYAELLESITRYYEEVIPPPEGTSFEPVDVLLFNTSEGYFGYVEFAAGDRHENTSGNFNPWYGQLMLYESSDAEETRGVLYHEGFHSYLWRVLPGAPAWLAEGMAEYVAGSRVEKGRVAAAGLVRANRLRDLRFAMRYGWKPEKFWKIMAEGPMEFYTVQPAFKYAQAWSMVHFLRECGDPAVRDLLGRYLRALAAGDGAKEAFDATFGKADPDAIEQRWLEHVAKLKAE